MAIQLWNVYIYKKKMFKLKKPLLRTLDMFKTFVYKL